MKKTMMWLSVFILTSVCTLAQSWKPAGDKIKTLDRKRRKKFFRSWQG